MADMMNTIVTALKAGERNLGVTGLSSDGAAALVAAQVCEETERPILCVVATERKAVILEQDIAFFSNTAVVHYPGYDIPPYTPLSPDQTTVASRLAVLSQCLTTEGPYIVVAAVEALLSRVVPRQLLSQRTELVIRGEDVDIVELLERLAGSGYEACSLVQTTGDFSRRGGVLDIFPPGFPCPIRLDFFGDTVETIRSFDPISQRSIEELEEAILAPASDIFFPTPGSEEMFSLIGRFREWGREFDWDPRLVRRLEEAIQAHRRFPGIEFFLSFFCPVSSSLFEYFPRDVLVLVIDPLDIRRSTELVWERINANALEARASRTPALPPEKLFLSEEQVIASWQARDHVLVYDFVSEETQPEKVFPLSLGSHKLLKQTLELERRKQGLLAPLAGRLREWQQKGDRVALACRSPKHAEQIGDFLRQYDLPVAVLSPPCRFADLHASQVCLYGGPLSEGFDVFEEGIHVFSEVELFGERRLGLAKKGRGNKKEPPLAFDELQVGDVVVHQDHGLGIYEGLINLSLNGIANDFLVIAYQGQDKLYVPVDRLNLVHKYKGLDASTPKIDKLGGRTWSNTKSKVKDAVWKVAQDLLELYAHRQVRQGKAFSSLGDFSREFEESFSYDETTGQDKAIDEILADLMAERPMDRLLCGDVGYGKTEVALRAAVKVIEDGYQVAVLVPTTVLAEQHSQTFRERLAGFPVRVESLNRFRTAAEQRSILADLASGTVDIVIGTHRLLQKDVTFKRLGLVVVDEEHRFGVSHKERLKKMRSEVDVLTLTATPIPRTLQMSLFGIRDLSVINTPPAFRQSIKTFVARYDDLVIKEAVVRELQRKGQVFLVHNRVQSIYEMAARVQRLVPEARVAVAHGQLPARNLEEIMVRFVRRELDLLVCTTIIESGLDIPNANTIIINRADRLGLAEIYQLRGRVGRSSEQAYAYLLVPSIDGLSRDAQKRLKALMEYSELGGGFKLAMSDLQIRGGGNLLGVSQSGHIAAVGYDLYLDLLAKTVEDLKCQQYQDAMAEPEAVDPEITIRTSAYIPEGYISDLNQRYVAYRRLAGLGSPEELLDIRNELRDRYGPLPVELENLIEVVALKQDLRRLRISKVEQGEGVLVFSFMPDTSVAPQTILHLVQGSRQKIRFTPDSRLVVQIPEAPATGVVGHIKKILHALGQHDIAFH